MLLEEPKCGMQEWLHKMSLITSRQEEKIHSKEMDSFISSSSNVNDNTCSNSLIEHQNL
jgi:hypothetical protein